MIIIKKIRKNQSYSRWFNKKYKRSGTLWSDRFKGVIVQKGEAQLLCAAYIDLNAVRANIVEKPEDYRWCSLGMRVRAPRRAKKLLTWFPVSHRDSWENIGLLKTFSSMKALDWYRLFVYQAGGKKLENKAGISEQLVNDVACFHGKLFYLFSLFFSAALLAIEKFVPFTQEIDGPRR